ncbi:unnamed protein product [Paramecium pentaurelia]|uniref:Transmembrane protein n=1 Tax=Paramecium pentaurelia TaxID=43138 RepID=A0A8S1WLB8_9CILI|nr:unnamed protein product [Paramecium pentaurelia]
MTMEYINQTCTLSTSSKITTQNICINVANCYWCFNTNTCQTLSSCDDLIFKVSAVQCAALGLSCAAYEQIFNNNKQIILNLLVVKAFSFGITLIIHVHYYNTVITQLMLQFVEIEFMHVGCKDFIILIIDLLNYFKQQKMYLCPYELYRQKNSIGPQGACENAYSALLQTSQTCLNYTSNTFRWRANDKSAGMSITNYSSLTATNQLECININASCKGISYGNFLSFPGAILYTTSGNCYNNIGTDGVCFLSTTEQTTQSIGFSQCTQATNETMCLRNQFSYSWKNLNNMCSQIN